MQRQTESSRLFKLFRLYNGDGLDERQRQLLHEQAARCLSHLFGFILLFMPVYVIGNLLGWQAFTDFSTSMVVPALFYYITWFMWRTPVNEALFDPDAWTAEKLPQHLATARQSALLSALAMPAIGLLALYMLHDGFVPLTFLLILATIAAWAIYAGLYDSEKKDIAANMQRAEAYRRQAEAEEHA
ncbi:hypothetical protein [Neisseria shayeganii]|uniref:Uncharacterized protein n=1 Tax=Neisseria shayeganii TaxID=607712 RepID=A0A7D7S7E7_9NEIS|nr:hypothetical protein [Neisseria shayeganii]QMT39911.1 hypothetical protein H3L94_08570 [Neisseria shayeganii]